MTIVILGYAKLVWMSVCLMPYDERASHPECISTSVPVFLGFTLDQNKALTESEWIVLLNEMGEMLAKVLAKNTDFFFLAVASLSTANIQSIV